jgi:Flp pilus assembly secretin CpaC
MTALCVRGLAARRALHWLSVGLFLATVASRALAGEAITVPLDDAKLMKIPDRAATVVIGNPLIADITVEAGGLAVITGKSYGATNVIVMDHSGAVLAEQTVVVTGPSDKTVVVYRGIDRSTYSCMPNCEVRITLGDEDKYFTTAMTQTGTRNTQSLAAGAGASSH